MKEKVEEMWAKYNAFKETSEQHDFVKLIMFDMRLVPAYNDLQKNWDNNHAQTFINGMNIVFNKLGIK